MRAPRERMSLYRRTILVAAFILAGLPLLAFGQAPMTAAEWAAFSTERLRSALDLTEEQVEKINALNTRIFRRAEEKHNLPEGGKAAMARAVRRVLQGRENELKKTLTPAQWRRSQTTRLEQGVLFRTEMLSLVLQLSAEQADRAGEINEEAFRKIQETQKRYLASKLKMVEAVRTIREERETELQATLTPEQWKTYQETQREIPDLFHPKMKEKRGPENPPGKTVEGVSSETRIPRDPIRRSE